MKLLSPKPPIGLCPRWFALEQRLQKVKDAIKRYESAGASIPQEWYDEEYDLIQEKSNWPYSRGFRAQVDWQPIESAPKDGTPIMVHCNKWADMCNLLNTYVVEWQDNERLGGGWMYGNNLDCPIEPTHWRHLPDMPPSDNGVETVLALAAEAPTCQEVNR